ncbi:hypothetical protein G6F42_013264 [Rhizopus arrhizus]|nr:hypothetical protein G6F42_013264 [Rhizopus arrhizus]
MPDSSVDQASQENSKQPAAVAEEEPSALDQPSSLEVAPSLEEPSSLEWENIATPSKDNDQQNDIAHPSTPQNDCAAEGEQEEEPSTALPANAPPALFKGLSIESMYSLWTSSTSSLFVFEEEVVDDASPSKRLKHTNSDGSIPSTKSNKTNHAGANTDEGTTGIVQTNIYKEIHTKIII